MEAIHQSAQRPGSFRRPHSGPQHNENQCRSLAESTTASSTAVLCKAHNFKDPFLESSVLFRHSHCRADGYCDAKALAVLLEEAQSLQTLKLYGEDGDKDFLQCFRPSLPKLSELCLFGVTTTEQNLIDTLLAYRTTLARLDLKMVALAVGQSSGSWHQFFRRVPESLPCLLEICLRSLHYIEQPAWPAFGFLWFQHKLEPPYLKAVEHAIMNGTDIPEPT